MSEKGLVTEVYGNHISVTISSLSNCGSCKACDAYKKQSDLIIEIENTCQASVGDYVLVDIGRTIVTGSVIFYVIPILVLISGILLGLWIAPGFVPQNVQEPVAAAIGVFLLLVYCLAVRLATPFIKKRTHSPKAISIVQMDSTYE